MDSNASPTLSVPMTMNFPDAIKKIMEGKRVARISWANQDYGVLKDGWLTIFTKGEFHTWTVNDGDMNGEDWTVVDDAEQGVVLN